MERVIVKNISKKFRRGSKKSKSDLVKFLSFFSGRQRLEDFWALKNISFSARIGENIGIIGRNGSGKTTLLRIIAGIYESYTGKVQLNGREVYLTGFGIGLKKRLTTRENIFLMGSLMGLSKKEVRERFDEIVKLSGLRDNLDTKVYQFSSGMITRLNFSSTILCVSHKNPDIILLDEVFSAGADIDFKEKALKKTEEFITGGATVILVSHSLGLIKKYCDRAIWLDKGEIVKEGTPEEVISAYVAANTEEKNVKKYLKKEKNSPLR